MFSLTAEQQEIRDRFMTSLSSESGPSRSSRRGSKALVARCPRRSDIQGLPRRRR